MSFFSQFPKIKYDINADGVKTDLTDMFRYVDVKEGLIDNIGTYSYYEILEGERPDVVSNRLYGTPDYYWTFFVLNDNLKNVLNDWPKSYRQFEQMLEQDYADYSTLIFIPTQNPVARKYENGFEMVNYFGGLDLSTGNIRIRAQDNAADGSKVEAEILKFDDQRYQLWVYNINNTGYFSRNRRWNIIYTENPNETSSVAWNDFEIARSKWASEALEWTRKNQTTVYYAFLLEIRFQINIITGSAAYYNYFLEKFFQKINFVSHRFFEESYNAPSYFIDSDSEDESATAFDAYDGVYNPNDIILGDDFIVGDLDENVLPTKEDGFDQSEIAQYNEISRQRKYIPSFVKRYTVTQAKFVSIKDDLDQKTFEARKIRVIRPEHIDEFVELYQEKLLK